MLKFIVAYWNATHSTFDLTELQEIWKMPKVASNSSEVTEWICSSFCFILNEASIPVFHSSGIVPISPQELSSSALSYQWWTLHDCQVAVYLCFTVTQFILLYSKTSHSWIAIFWYCLFMWYCVSLYLQMWALSDNLMSRVHTKPVSHVLSVGEQVYV